MTPETSVLALLLVVALIAATLLARQLVDERQVREWACAERDDAIRLREAEQAAAAEDVAMLDEIIGFWRRHGDQLERERDAAHTVIEELLMPALQAGQSAGMR